MRRSEIVAAGRTLLGTPFQHQGRTPGVAMDCGGVIVHIARLMGIEHDAQGYSRRPDGNKLVEVVDQALVRIPKEAYQPGDVICVRFMRDPQHLALVTDYGMLHAWQRVKTPAKVVEHLITDEWRRRIVAAWKFPAVVD